MAFLFRNRTIGKVGVIGSGQIGPDIALHFAKSLYRYGTQVVVVDIVDEALAKGKAKLFKKIDKGGQTGAFKPQDVEGMKSHITFTSDYSQLKGADVVVEAATEDLPLKRRIFRQVEELVGPQAILTSNSSHIEPERIFEEAEHKGRALCTHYFFPAERNQAIEIIPGKDTDPETTEFVMRFYEFIGKIPVKVGSRYGYAVDPVFEGLLLACVQCVDAGLGDTKQVDTVASKCLGLNVGPFTAQNLTGGNPITAHGLSEMNERLNPWFRVPERLKKIVESNSNWEVPARGETIEVPPDKEKLISDELKGAYFAMVCDMLDAGIISTSDFDLVISVALDMNPPFSFMNSIGVGRSLELVEDFAKKYPDMPVSKTLREQALSGKPWQILDVLFEKRGDVGLITIRRPKALNAINSKVTSELKTCLDVIKNDPEIKCAVITGYGNKAFVAGADIKEMSGFTEPAQGEAFARRAQIATSELEKLGKPIVAALNGLAFGGGSELALCCTARVAPKGLKILAGQPEVNLGLIPGMGGTQRLTRLIGFEKAARMVRTANPISSAQALEYGLINEEVEGDVLPNAIALARKLAYGEVTVKLIEKGPLADVPASLPEVDIEHHSRAIDELLSRAILEGAKMTLEDGLKNEAKLFGECWTKEDNKIGLKTFVEQGARAKPEFVHR
ncbi:MAG: 3-hydroxyacyl-CoA dehydrogenase/enoyl-CoA hydratase family protein [Desulfomonile sp.]|nr:3-hydroxyacyl-CoA dehydrogenase/enoyl-CoA hydratase family protein [Deltaproteobacteria bacterium]